MEGGGGGGGIGKSGEVRGAQTWAVNCTFCLHLDLSEKFLKYKTYSAQYVPLIFLVDIIV